jgi:hypothetical protein
MDEPLCERRFKRFAHGATTEIVARVWEPQSAYDIDNPNDCCCHLEITGLPQSISRDVRGIDEMQALWLALGAVHRLLRLFQAEMTWFGNEPDAQIGTSIVFNPLDFEMQSYFEELPEREMTAYVNRRIAERRITREGEK